MAAMLRRWAITGMIGFGIAAFLYAAVLKPTTSQADGSLARLATGEMEKLIVVAPEDAVTLPQGPYVTADGWETDLSAYEGQVVLLNLWATWCAPCVKEMPALARLEAAMGSDQFAVIPVAVEEVIEDPLDFYMENDLGDLPFLVDPSLNIGFALQAPGMPTTVLFDSTGREVARYLGEAEWDSPEAMAVIQAVIDRSFIAVP